MKKTNWRGQECPPNYEIIRNGGMKQVILYTDIEKSEQQADEYTATRIAMPIGEFDYGNIVSVLINEKYPADKMQAIINNHLIGDGIEAFDEMQTFRKYAKALAKEILAEVYPENDEEQTLAQPIDERL